MHNQLAETDLIAVAQHARLVWDEALAVEVRAVDAAKIDERQRVRSPPDRGVHPRNALFERTVGRQVEVRGRAAAGVEPPQDGLLLRLEQNRFGRVTDVHDDGRVAVKARGPPRGL